MPFRVIRGTFHIKGYSPDGDSIRFQADKEENWKLLEGHKVTLNAKRHAQLRLEAIDTLELHFQKTHQPLSFAKQALEFLLKQLGITDVQWQRDGLDVVDAKDGTKGYIIAREIEKNHRPVAFVFAGTPTEQDGADVYLEPARLSQSVNYEMLKMGYGYPTYYKGLFYDLRNALTEVVLAARKEKKGIWSQDKTNIGFTVPSLKALANDIVILPKLFRRLAVYLEAGGTVENFHQYLAQLEEGVFIISKAHASFLDNIVEVKNNQIRMIEPPENLIFEG